MNRQRLPAKIAVLHPILQRRYRPFTDLMLNKVVPICGQVAAGTVSTYLALAGGCKALNGVSEIDPIRNKLLNRYYKFPFTHRWNELTLGAWSTFRKQKAIAELLYEEQVSTFITKEDAFVEVIGRAVKTFVDKGD